MNSFRIFTAQLFSAAALSAACFAGDIAIVPETATLQGLEGRQHLLVLKKDGEFFAGEAEGVTLVSSNPDIVSISNSEIGLPVALAKANGEVTITATDASGTKSTATVKVTAFDQAHTWSFSNHVLPVLSRNNCNTGGCHGSIAGKGGFRLSLNGYDPPSDFFRMTREMRGRRIEMADPARSLVLTKPTQATPHKGGKRLHPTSRDYRVVAEWITNGADAPSEKDAALARLEVLPELSQLKPGQTQRVVVMAHYADGKVEDVTSWVRWSSADETVAEVDKNGTISVIGHGQGAVTAWFSSQVAISRVTVPFPNDIPDSFFTDSNRANFIDDLALVQLRQLNLKPSPRTTDNQFVRRVFVDTIGKLPTIEETQEFVADKDPDKRTKLIAALLERPEFVSYWTYRWSDMFLVNGRLLRPDQVEAYYKWIRGNVEKNTPWDQMARELVTAKGSSVENGATNFYAVHQDPETMAENVSQAFLSLSIGCAKCHNHPLEKWTNDQYYAFANLFSRVRAKGWGGDARNGDGIRTLYVEPRGDLIQPRTGKPQPPAPLDGDIVDPDSEMDRRDALAEWLVAPENPYFARSITNRVWAAFFGKGIVEPVDDLRASNPASNEPLLAALSDHLVKNKFDLKSIMRVILESETYQRSSEALPENEKDERQFSHYYPRRMMAEVLHDAIADVTKAPAMFKKIKLNDGSTADTKHYKDGARALELYDSAVDSYFLKTFGRNDRDIACECERSNQPSMVQVLHLSNGDTLNKKLSQKESIVETLMSEKDVTDESIITAAYMACLSREPEKRELDGFRVIFKQTPELEKRTAVEDLFWALMTSREFLFQH
ncbi:DUF1553 domain-containing protein [Verrucomicrobiales bacterium]|nr:DUF1553 domain-containing protein [Verrucomicrobiales bacterium]